MYPAPCVKTSLLTSVAPAIRIPLTVWTSGNAPVLCQYASYAKAKMPAAAGAETLVPDTISTA